MLSLTWVDSSLALDLTPLASGTKFSSGKHGFAQLSTFIQCGQTQAFYCYNRPGVPKILVSNGCDVVYEGRVEDVAIVPGGVQIAALGYWRAYSDLPYTELWSATTLTDWRVMNQNDGTFYSHQKHEMDTNNNRLYMAPRKNEVFAVGFDAAGYTYAIPHQRTQRNITVVSFDYELYGSANWRLRLASMADDLTGGLAEWSLDGNGALQTGTVTQVLATPNDRVAFWLYFLAASATYTGETGAYYAKITNLRLKTVNASVYASVIAGALAAHVNTTNSGQASASTALIDSPGVDLMNELYEDAAPADILDRLSGLGDSASPPNVWETGVYEQQLLYFRARGGAAAKAWYVDVVDLPTIERTLDALANNTYSIYRDASGRTLRTADQADQDSVATNGLTRTRAVGSSTTNSTQAGVQRDAALADGKNPVPRTSIPVGRIVYDASGAVCPSYLVRAGDTVTIRNIPPTAGTSIDRVRTFRVAETNWTDGADLPLGLVPESPLPALDLLTARTAAGLAQV